MDHPVRGSRAQAITSRLRDIFADCLHSARRRTLAVIKLFYRPRI